jgi:ribonuclease Z
MIVVPLGIASATPTAVRHLPAVALWREGSVYLFDCGENAQMSMLQAGLKRSKIECIFISHFDVDHYSGLMGLISTLQLQRRDRDLTIVGPKGVKEFVEWNLSFSGVELGFTINYSEVEEGAEETKVVDEEDFYVEARPLKHKRFCLGYRFQEKDKPGKVDAAKANALGITEDEQFKQLKAGNPIKLKDGSEIESYEIVGHPRPGDSFAYVTDTEYCPNAVKLAMNTNILYHEATFSNQLADKARETGHSTASDAARVANEAQTKLLVIGHFSARYTNLHVLLKEARDGFYPTWLANELRPIFTDPTHERGIVEAKVELKDLTKKPSNSNYSNNRGGGGRDHRGGGGKNFRSRKPRGRSGGGGGYRGNSRYDNDRGGSRYDNDRGGSRYDNDRGGNRYNSGGRGGSDRYNKGSDRGGSGERRYGNPHYSNRRKDDNNSNNESQPRSITPRTSYDDFDRF